MPRKSPPSASRTGSGTAGGEERSATGGSGRPGAQLLPGRPQGDGDRGGAGSCGRSGDQVQRGPGAVPTDNCHSGPRLGRSPSQRRSHLPRARDQHRLLARATRPSSHARARVASPGPSWPRPARALRPVAMATRTAAPAARRRRDGGRPPARHAPGGAPGLRRRRRSPARPRPGAVFARPAGHEAS